MPVTAPRSPTGGHSGGRQHWLIGSPVVMPPTPAQKQPADLGLPAVFHADLFPGAYSEALLPSESDWTPAVSIFNGLREPVPSSLSFAYPRRSARRLSARLRLSPPSARQQYSFRSAIESLPLARSGVVRLPFFPAAPHVHSCSHVTRLIADANASFRPYPCTQASSTRQVNRSFPDYSDRKSNSVRAFGPVPNIS
jgi:hypothetical protein